MSEIKFDGDKLFKVRKEKGFSQEKLALAIGVSRQTIYLWESNQSLPDVEKVGKICKILEIKLSDIVDGVDIPKVININDSTNDNTNEKYELKEEIIQKHKKTKFLILKIILIFIIIAIITYLVISILKFIRLNKILNRWNKLDEANSYYMNVQEFLVSKHDNNFEKIYFEKYFFDGVLTMVWTNSKSKDIEFITIYDYNEKYRYLINEKEKTYVKEKLDLNDRNKDLTFDLKKKLGFSENNFLNFIFCFNPNFNILYNDSYELVLKNRIRENIDADTGLIYSEKTLDSKNTSIERYYEIELDTDKTFEVDLDEYTEVTQ